MYKLLVLFFLLFLISKVDAQEMKTDSVKAKDTTFMYVPYRYEDCKRRSPVLALGLDFIFPAAGQVYNKQYLKAGAIWFVALSAGIGLLANNTQAKPYDKAHPPFIIQYKKGNETTNHVLIAVFLADVAYAFIDAPLSAIHINKKYNLGNKRPSLSSVQITPDVISTGVGNKVAAGFSLVLR
jgi:hypothetical protein